MSKRTTSNHEQVHADQLTHVVESMGIQLDIVDWVRSLQWSIKAIASEHGLSERVRLERVNHLSSASLYLIGDALESLRDDVNTLHSGGEA